MDINELLLLKIIKKCKYVNFIEKEFNLFSNSYVIAKANCRRLH